MFATFKKDLDWEALDASKTPPFFASVKAGRYELEKIPNPMIKDGVPWLVLKGTMIGKAEYSWREGNDDIIFEE